MPSNICFYCKKKINILRQGSSWEREFDGYVIFEPFLNPEKFIICVSCLERSAGLRLHDAHKEVNWCGCHECEVVYNNTSGSDSAGCRNCGLCSLCTPSDHFCTSSFFRKTIIDQLPNFSADDRLVGVEVEVVDPLHVDIWPERGALWKEIDKHIGVAHDGSVSNSEGENGFELVTPPIKKSEFPSYITSLVSSIQTHNFKVNKTCGFHVHFDGRDIVHNPVNIAHVLRTIYSIEDIILSMNPASRWNNRYCQRLSQNYYFSDFDHPMEMRDFENYWYAIGNWRMREISPSRIMEFKSSKYGHAKYSGVNFHSMMYRGTIEFRYHAATLQVDKMINWVEFLSRLLTYGCYEYEDKDVVKLYEMRTNQDKLEQMVTLFHIPKVTAEYMTERVGKFNEGFVKYNTSAKEESERLKKTLDSIPSPRRPRIADRLMRVVPRPPSVSHVDELMRAAESISAEHQRQEELNRIQAMGFRNISIPSYQQQPPPQSQQESIWGNYTQTVSGQAQWQEDWMSVDANGSPASDRNRS